MQSKKICILSKDYAAILGRAFQMSRILGCLQAEFLDRDDIHASPTQSFRHGFRDMLIHVEPEPISHRFFRSAWTWSGSVIRRHRIHRSE